MDCMEGMKEFPDKYFDLAIVDPPYGGAGQDVNETFNGAIQGRFGGTFEKYFKGDKRGHMGGGHAKKYGYGHWDIAPTKEYFKELFRVSKNQIIWGVITLNYRRQGALLFGVKQMSQKNFQWLCVNMRGLLLTRTQKLLSCQQQTKRDAFTPHKNLLRYTNGF